MNVLKGLAVAVLVFATVATASAGELVREFKGTGNMTTPAFSVESPWIIDWRLDSDYEMKIALDIVLLDAKTGRFLRTAYETLATAPWEFKISPGGRFAVHLTAGKLGFMPLTRANNRVQRDAVAARQQVELRSEAAPRVAERVVRWLLIPPFCHLPRPHARPALRQRRRTTDPHR